jgi:hypothetical protein
MAWVLAIYFLGTYATSLWLALNNARWGWWWTVLLWPLALILIVGKHYLQIVRDHYDHIESLKPESILYPQEKTQRPSRESVRGAYRL